MPGGVWSFDMGAKATTPGLVVRPSRVRSQAGSSHHKRAIAHGHLVPDARVVAQHHLLISVQALDMPIGEQNIARIIVTKGFEALVGADPLERLKGT